MTSSQVEHEVKLAAGPQLVLPDWTLLPGVVEVDEADTFALDATYVDTEDQDLLAAGITLRRRRGGHDAGWHLKLPAGAARREVHAPLGRSATQVPPRLRRLVRSRTLDRPLAPVARVRTARRTVVLRDGSGRALAEVADDAVTAERLGTGSATPALTAWREVEVELLDAGPDLLDAAAALLREAGATDGGRSKLARALGTEPAPATKDRTKDRTKERTKQRTKQRTEERVGAGRGTAGEVAVAYLAEQVEEIRATDPGVRLDLPDAVHRMRVAARRLRSVLATVRPVLGREAVEPLREELRWLGSTLGDARDLEVLRERLLATLDTLPAAEVVGDVRERLDAHLSADRDEARRAAAAALDGARYLRLLQDLDRLVVDPPRGDRFDDKATTLSKRVRKDAERVLERAAAGAVDDGAAPEQDELVHEVRKAAKRARYAAEVARPVLGTPATRLVKRMKALTTTLGVHQDSVVARRALREDLAPRAQADGTPTFTYGVLHEHEAGVAEELRRDLPRALRRARKAAKRLT